MRDERKRKKVGWRINAAEGEEAEKGMESVLWGRWAQVAGRQQALKSVKK